MTVYSFDPNRTKNSQAILDAAKLGHLKVTDRILDCTYGLGRFWKEWCPPDLTRTDIKPRFAPDGVVDFTEMPWDAGTFDVAVLDPPYKLNGTSSGKGPATSDEGYGVDEYMPWRERHEQIKRGISECIRVTGPHRKVLVKCMDQVSSGAVRWQTMEFTRHAEEKGARLVDELYVVGERQQPEGRRQVHARRTLSSLLIFENRLIVG